MQNVWCDRVALKRNTWMLGISTRNSSSLFDFTKNTRAEIRLSMDNFCQEWHSGQWIYVCLFRMFSRINALFDIEFDFFRLKIKRKFGNFIEIMSQVQKMQTAAATWSFSNNPFWLEFIHKRFAMLRFL